MNISNYAAMSLLKRSDFLGVTDVYARSKQTGLVPGMEIALQGTGPFDVKGNLFSDNFRDVAIERIARYRHGWNFYKGDHWVQPYEDGDRKPVFNYCATIVDKAVEWYTAKGIKIVASRGNEQVSDLLNSVWCYNYQDTLLQKLAQFGAVTGDSFVYVSINSKDLFGNTLPKSQWTISLKALNPAYVFPFWSESQPDEIIAALVQYPLLAGKSSERLFTMYITPEYFETWINQESQGQQPNLFKKVNLVYFPNLILANSLFGLSDIDRVIAVNEEYNTVANSIRKVIKYQGEPTTLIYGTRMSNLERSANAVWSNLPIDAKVENLKLDSDLKANFEYLTLLESQIWKMGSTPKLAVEAAGMAISNTSGLAMQMLYQPLIEKTERRQAGHKKPFKQVNELILIGHENYLGDNIRALADYPDEIYDTETVFTSSLPKDEIAEVDLVMKKLSVGLTSRAQAIRDVSNVSDFERLIVEIAADERAELFMTYEQAQATQGERPNLSAIFLSSPFLGEDLQKLATPDSPSQDGNGEILP